MAAPVGWLDMFRAIFRIPGTFGGPPIPTPTATVVPQVTLSRTNRPYVIVARTNQPVVVLSEQS